MSAAATAVLVAERTRIARVRPQRGHTYTAVLIAERTHTELEYDLKEDKHIKQNTYIARVRAHTYS